MGNRGKREFIHALRLIEVFPETLVAAAALDAIRLGAISFDAVKQLETVRSEVFSRVATSSILTPCRRSRMISALKRLRCSMDRPRSHTAL